MDEFASADAKAGDPVPEKLQALFNNADDVRVRAFPCALPDQKSMGAGPATINIREFPAPAA